MAPRPLDQIRLEAQQLATPVVLWRWVLTAPGLYTLTPTRRL